MNLKNFLKGKERIRKVAEFVAKHYKENVVLLGYKAFKRARKMSRPTKAGPIASSCKSRAANSFQPCVVHPVR